MKILKFLIVSFVFITTSSYFYLLNAQELAPNFLFLFGQIEVPSNVTITHTLSAQGTYWEYDDVEYIISSNSEWEEASASITGSTTTNPVHNCTADDWPGFYFSWRGPTCLEVDYIAYGFYKVTNSYNDDYFYIDLRDCKYAGGSPPCTHYNPDFFIRFDDFTDVFEWRRGGDWQLISTGEVLKVWEIANNGTPPTTTTFEDFWDNALVLVNDGNDHPLLAWGPFPNEDFAVQYYRVYKKEGSSNFQIVHTTTELDWIDTDETIVTGPRQANEGICYYKITAVGWLQDEPIETGYTNTVDTRVEGDPLEKIGYNSSNRLVEEFSLHQNYPNPFNPTTQIKYSIQRDGFVLLKVYDILGNEVAALVEEPKLAGNHTVDFNASDLPSGIYFYQLQSENFTDTKKMILLR